MTSSALPSRGRKPPPRLGARADRRIRHSPRISLWQRTRLVGSRSSGRAEAGAVV